MAITQTEQVHRSQRTVQSPGFLCLLPEPAFLLGASPHLLHYLFLLRALHTDQRGSLYPEIQSPVAKRKRRSLGGDLKGGLD